MYKIMIVDDEVKVRDSLVKLIDLEKIGFTLAGTASNGMEALEYFDEDDVEVLITDINMPFLDGIGLVSEIRNRGNDCRIIFLTGYNEFEYAKEAVTLNVDKYILKPITKKDLEEVLFEIKQSLDHKYNKSKQIEQLQDEFNKNKIFFSEMTIFDILDGRLPSNMLKDSIAVLGKHCINNTSTAIAILDIKVDGDMIKKHFESNYPMFFYTMSEFCRNNLEPKGEFLVIKGKDNRLIVICLNIRELTYLETIFSQLIRKINLTFDVDLAVGIGNERKCLEELKYSYDEAIASLEYQLIDGKNRVIIYRENTRKTKLDEKMINSKISDIVENIGQNNIEKINAELDLFLSILRFNRVEISVFRAYTLNLMLRIFERFHEYILEDDFTIDFVAISTIVNSKSENEIKESIVENISNIMEFIEKNKMDKRHEIILEATEYLKGNYSKPYIDLASLSDMLHISTSYISKEFKRIMGKTVIEYLTDIRMNKAKELLKNTDKKVFEISVEVGYEDPNYFSYNFRKHIGTSPLKYRKES